ncbi:MAG TPA: tetratricopeptide repeat protein, partial [Thermodesulfobacteriota bacterium]|nr:tetratricopeptide repeat protein [Thermodesulfobacteriota bacterium]
GGTIWRKGPDILLEAYRKAFTAKDDVCLVIKDMGGNSFYQGQTCAQRIREIQADPDAPEILYCTENISPRNLPGLYTACDCLVHPYRGEGFGLPMAEAMACGLPVIATGAGACLDFCEETTAFLIRADRRNFPQRRIDRLETADFPYYYEPDAEDTARLMRRLFENPGEGAKAGERARARIAQDFTWEHTCRRIVERVRLLRDRPVRRFQRTAESETLSIAMGEELFARGDIEGAKKVFTRMLAGDANNIEALNDLGVIAYQQGQVERGISFFTRVVELNPGHFEAAGNLGNCLATLKAYERAAQWFEKALRLRPDDVALLNSLANCFIQIGDFSSAGEVYARSYRLNMTQPKVGEILSNLERLKTAQAERRPGA